MLTNNQRYLFERCLIHLEAAIRNYEMDEKAYGNDFGATKRLAKDLIAEIKIELAEDGK